MSDATSNDGRRAAIYARARPQAAATLDQQVATLRAWLGEQGVMPVVVVRELASANDDQRPGLEALLRAGEREQINQVIMIDLARLARDLSRVVGWLEAFGARGVTITIGSRSNRLAAAESSLSNLSARSLPSGANRASVSTPGPERPARGSNA